MLYVHRDPHQFRETVSGQHYFGERSIPPPSSICMYLVCMYVCLSVSLSLCMNIHTIGCEPSHLSISRDLQTAARPSLAALRGSAVISHLEEAHLGVTTY